MKFEPIKIFREQQFSIEKELESGKYCVTFPVYNGLGGYEEYYEISHEEFNIFMNNTDLLIEFTNGCILHKNDDRLMEKPGRIRGGKGVILQAKKV